MGADRPGQRMHRFDAASDALATEVVAYALDRVRLDPPPLDGTASLSDLRERVGYSIGRAPRDPLEVLGVFADVLAPACVSVDHPLHLSFVPGAPTEASVLFDLVVSASNIYGGSWLEASGAVYAENEALRWLADLAGLPAGAGGTFVSGGSAGNLSALVAARWRWRRDGGDPRGRPLILASGGSHSSVLQAAHVIDADVRRTDTDRRGRTDAAAMTALVESLDDVDRARVVAVVGTAGTTNVGVVDDLEGLGRVASDLGTWFHVDGAYGAAALCAPSARHLFAGIERADSLIVDPHKWLFGPYDCCALLYRDPFVARRAHAQHAEYLDVLDQDDLGDEMLNPSDLAYHLSRRARGLPFWFSLAVHGTDAYAEAMEETLGVAREIASLVAAAGHLELVMEPDLSVVVVRRPGWGPADYAAWSDRTLRDGRAFVVPSTWRGETVLRLCIVNPRTTVAAVAGVLESMR